MIAVALTGTVLLLFLFTVLVGLPFRYVEVLILVPLLRTVIREGNRELTGNPFWPSHHEALGLVRVLAVVAGAVATHLLHVHLSVGSVAASGLVGLVAAILLPSLAVPVFCGTFVGMASPELFQVPQVVVSGLIAGVVYESGRGVFAGFGGKLGTIALIGCITTVLLWPGITFLPGAVTPREQLPLYLLWGALGAYGTFTLQQHIPARISPPVFASAVVGLAGAVTLEGTAALVVFAASFAGMSSSERIPYRWLMIPAGIITALVVVYSAPVFGGTGGKLGAAAFGAVIAVHGVHRAHKPADSFDQPSRGE